MTTRGTRVNIKEDKLRDKELLRKMKKDGWKVVRIQGSHHILKKEGRLEVLPVHGKEIPTGLLNAILKRTGLK